MSLCSKVKERERECVCVCVCVRMFVHVDGAWKSDVCMGMS